MTEKKMTPSPKDLSRYENIPEEFREMVQREILTELEMIQLMRKKKGMSVDQLAQKIDKSVDYVRSLESARTIPSLEIYILIKKILDF